MIYLFYFLFSLWSSQFEFFLQFKWKNIRCGIKFPLFRHSNRFLFSQRRLNVDCYEISPDLNFILLYECLHESDSGNDWNGTKYFVYEIFSTNNYPLTPKTEEVELQKILWSPGSYESPSLVSNENNNNRNHQQQLKKVLPANNKAKLKFEKSKLSQAIAFIYNYDIFYKPKIHSDLVVRVTSNGKLLLSFLRFCQRHLKAQSMADWLYCVPRAWMRC